jgi:hypothetical protein
MLQLKTEGIFVRHKNQTFLSLWFGLLASDGISNLFLREVGKYLSTAPGYVMQKTVIDRRPYILCIKSYHENVYFWGRGAGLPGTKGRPNLKQINVHGTYLNATLCSIQSRTFNKR